MSSDPYDLAERGLFGQAFTCIPSVGDLPIGLRVLRAQIEVHVGTPVRAREMAHGLLKARLTNKEKSSCWELIGRECLRTGRLEDGLRAMTTAFAAAAAAQDSAFEARLRANYVYSLLHWVGVEPAVVEVPKLREVAMRAGDGYAMIAAHTLVAEINLRKGQPQSALASLEVAGSLLDRFDNAWHRGRRAIAGYAVSMLQSDYDSALNWNREALDCARRSDSREIRIPALANLAYLKIERNQLDDARIALDDLTSEIQTVGFSLAEIGVRDLRMQLSLAAGDLTSALVLENLISNLISEIEPTDSYYELWHLLNRVRLLYRLGRIDEGLGIARDAIPRIALSTDRNLLERMNLLAAEGYGRTGEPAKGIALIAATMLQNPHSSLAMTAETFRVIGQLVAAEDQDTALSYFERAERIFGSIGNLKARAEVRQDARKMLVLPAEVGIEQPNQHTFAGETPRCERVDQGIAVAPITERIATLVEIGAKAPLLGAEALSLLSDSGVTHRATLEAIDQEGQREILATYSSPGSEPLVNERHLEEVHISLGSLRDRQFEIIVLPLPTVSARTAVLSIERLVRSTVALSSARQLDRERTALWSTKPPERKLGLICSSERMLELIETIRRVAGSNVNVLLTGETGVGKELFARALHQASPRSECVFLPFNCATVPRDMFDSQLFGHKRGSFTGAHEDSPGVIRSAAGGTLFLDEIGEMTLDTQPKLLRFLESGDIQPLGDPRPQHVDVRVVAATNANLDQLVAEGRFREDLYYRLNVIRINIPPLRERREEIPALVEHFLERFVHELQKTPLRVADETLEYLVLYRWPGNIRQLVNEIHRMVAMAEPGAVLMPAHLSEEIVSSRRTIPADVQPRQSIEVVTRIDQPLAAAVEHIERAAIQRAVAASDGRLDEAARMLGLSRKGLYLKRQRLGLE
jgi:DNA-binding NtrC family response regulator/tetratricopeptide (TPR) repeat protein